MFFLITFLHCTFVHCAALQKARCKEAGRLVFAQHMQMRDSWLPYGQEVGGDVFFGVAVLANQIITALNCL
jgi:hypothetical protein